MFRSASYLEVSVKAVIKAAHRFIVLLVLLWGVSGCGSVDKVGMPCPVVTPVPTLAFPPEIVRHPHASPPIAFPCYQKPYKSLPSYDPSNPEWDQVDLRHCDISSLNLVDREYDLLHSLYDTDTQWPSREQLPDGFDPEMVMEYGENPGLDIRRLHPCGITGKGVGIAFVDSLFLVDHQEYADRIRMYEEIVKVKGVEQMPIDIHSTAVVSIAAGKNIGVAPEADLFVIGVYPADSIEEFMRGEVNHAIHAQAIRRILEINEQLPKSNKIRVISVTTGWREDDKGYDEVSAAVEEAKQAGVFVISSNIEYTHGFKMNGLGRNPGADPDDFASYKPAIIWEEYFPNGADWVPNRLLIPMDSRTTASSTGSDDYVFYYQGGWSP